jgi:hypothetical protein
VMRSSLDPSHDFGCFGGEQAGSHSSRAHSVVIFARIAPKGLVSVGGRRVQRDEGLYCLVREDLDRATTCARAPVRYRASSIVVAGRRIAKSEGVTPMTGRWILVAASMANR